MVLLEEGGWAVGRNRDDYSITYICRGEEAKGGLHTPIHHTYS